MKREDETSTEDKTVISGHGFQKDMEAADALYFVLISEFIRTTKYSNIIHLLIIFLLCSTIPGRKIVTFKSTCSFNIMRWAKFMFLCFKIQIDLYQLNFIQSLEFAAKIEQNY